MDTRNKDHGSKLTLKEVELFTNQVEFTKGQLPAVVGIVLEALRMGLREARWTNEFVVEFRLYKKRKRRKR